MALHMDVKRILAQWEPLPLSFKEKCNKERLGVPNYFIIVSHFNFLEFILIRFNDFNLLF